MASETEGIALLSMYNDEEEEDEEERQEDDGGDGIEQDADEIPKNNNTVSDKTPQDLRSPSPLLSDEGTDFKTLRSPTPPPLHFPQSQLSSPLMLTSPSPPPPPPPQSFIMESADGQRRGRGALAIVDYAHDEAAMSPEAEEGEIVSGGRVVFSTEIQASDGLPIGWVCSKICLNWIQPHSNSDPERRLEPNPWAYSVPTCNFI